MPQTWALVEGWYKGLDGNRRQVVQALAEESHKPDTGEDCSATPVAPERGAPVSRDREKKRAYNAAYHKAHQEERSVYFAAKYQENSEVNRMKSAIYYASHTPERRAYASAYRVTHRDKRREIENTYRLAHPEINRANVKRHDALKRGAIVSDFTAAQWVEMQSAYDHRCVYCSKRAKGHLTQDHITPLSKGGNHTRGNIVPACRSCNSRKGAGAVLVPIQPLLIL